MDKIERCFWCGRPKDESVVIEEENEDTLRDSIIKNYIPCDKCKREFGNGIHVIGVTKEPIVKGMFPISQDAENTLYPTGTMFVSEDSFVENMLADQKELLENVLKERVLLLPEETVADIVEQAQEAERKANEVNADNYDAYINDVLDAVEINKEEN